MLLHLKIKKEDIIMKPFFGIDITEDKDNETINGDEFVVAKTADEEAQALEEAVDEANELVKKSELPRALRVIRFFSGALALIAIVAIFKAISGYDGVTLAEGYKNAPWIFWTGGGCLLLWLALTIVGSAKEKEVVESEAAKKAVSELDEAVENVYEILEVPEDAENVDILAFNYKLKDGEPVPKERPFAMTTFFNIDLKVFSDGEYLYLTTAGEKYAFALSSMKAIYTVKKRILIPDWNKDTPPNKGEYKPYKMAFNNLECVSLKNYHILVLEREDEEWGIWFPCYELPVFEKLTGLSAQEGEYEPESDEE